MNSTGWGYSAFSRQTQGLPEVHPSTVWPSNINILLSETHQSACVQAAALRWTGNQRARFPLPRPGGALFGRVLAQARGRTPRTSWTTRRPLRLSCRFRILQVGGSGIWPLHHSTRLGRPRSVQPQRFGITPARD